MATAHGSLPHLLPPTYKRTIAAWLEEDCPSFDYGGFVVGAPAAEAHLYCKSPGILAGVPFFDEVFHQLHCSVTWHIAEGTAIMSTSPQSSPALPTKKIHTATVRGPTHALLLGERLGLNILARTSGIATATARFRQELRERGYTGAVAGTRKTTPGFRLCEKYAVAVGGGDMHRMDLSAMVMLKDNHVRACRGRRRRRRDAAAAAEVVEGDGVDGDRDGVDADAEGDGDGEGSIGRAVAAAKAAAGFSVKIEVECGNLAEAEAAVRAGADVVMLDNFTGEEVRRASRALRAMFDGDGDVGGDDDDDPSAGGAEQMGQDGARAAQGSRRGRGRKRRTFLIEVSGGLTAETVRSGGGGYLTDDVDIISTSSIHQGVPHVDFSLKIVEGAAAA